MQRKRGCPQNGRGATTPTACQPSELLTTCEWQNITDELRLSDRELQIAQGFLDGLDERRAALRIGISEHTVHTHVRRMYQKNGVGSRCEFLIRLFVAHLTGNGGAALSTYSASCNLIR
jgi:DNA-binding CsgD family transcriptional regulator